MFKEINNFNPVSVSLTHDFWGFLITKRSIGKEENFMSCKTYLFFRKVCCISYSIWRIIFDIIFNKGLFCYNFPRSYWTYCAWFQNILDTSKKKNKKKTRGQIFGNPLLMKSETNGAMFCPFVSLEGVFHKINGSLATCVILFFVFLYFPLIDMLSHIWDSSCMINPE